MYDAFRLIKDRLYRDSLQSWVAYRLEPIHGTLRLYAPAGTHVFDSSGWSEAPYAWQTLILPGESFVPHLWRRPDGGYGFYVDIARHVVTTDSYALWEDIHLDVLIEDGRVSEKDEEMLSGLPHEEAAHARSVRDDIRRRIDALDPMFQPGSDLWRVPSDLRAPLPRDRRLAIRPRR